MYKNGYELFIFIVINIHHIADVDGMDIEVSQTFICIKSPPYNKVSRESLTCFKEKRVELLNKT